MTFAIKTFKLLVGLTLLPACVAVTLIFKGHVLAILKTELYFFAGLFSYLALLAIFQQPIRTYVFGHELTHVIWVWIFGGKVQSFKASAAGGGVRVSKSNFLIFLAPYFFPVYSILAIALFLVLNLFFPVPGGMNVLSFVIGFTWAFHVTFTVYVLLQGQPDIGATGAMFSLPFIYVANVILLSCLVIFISPQVSYGQFFSDVWSGLSETYLFLWNHGPEFCRDCCAWCRETASNFYSLCAS